MDVQLRALRHSRHITQLKKQDITLPLHLFPILLATAGLGFACWLVATNDASAILLAFQAIGWGLLAMVVIRGIVVAVCAVGWSVLLQGRSNAPARAFQIVRLVREGVNALLPVATVGGDILGARLITFWGVRSGLAGASVMVDLLMQISSQAIFTLVAVALLAQVSGAGWVVEWSLIGLAVTIIALASFYAAQRHGGVRFLEHGFSRLLARLASGSGRTGRGLIGLNLGLKRVWSNPRAVALSFLLHLAAWFIAIFETWVALRCMGYPSTLAEAAILEGLGQAVMAVAFPVPAAIGVQEGGFLIIGQLLGIDPGIAIALSFAKRVPDIVLGLPGILSWQWLEKRRSHLRAMHPRD